MESDNLLSIAREQFKAGNKQEARNTIVKAISLDKKNPDLWFGLFYCLEDENQKRDCLKRVLFYKPGHLKAKQALDEMNQTKIKPTPSIPDPVVVTTFVKQKENNIIAEPYVQIPKNIRKAGTSTWDQAERIRKTGLIIGISIVFALLIIWLVIQNSSKLGINPYITISLFILFITSFFWMKKIIDPIVKKMEQFRRGARAEEKVGKMLDKLGANYFILHDIQTEHGNIDHVVFTKNGHIFALETKSHIGTLEIDEGRILINDHKPEKDFILQSLGNAYWLRDKLEPILQKKPWVIPILVFTRMYVPFNPPVKNVHIVNSKYLIKTIGELSNTKSQNQVWSHLDKILMALQ